MREIRDWTTCIFGGAILSAGIAAPDASAQSFTNQNTLAGAYAYDYDSYAGAFDGTMGFSMAPAASGSIDTLGSTATWAWDSVAGVWSGSFSQVSTEAYAYSNMSSLFSVSSAYQLEVSWDITSMQSLAGWQLFESEDLSFEPSELIDGVLTVTSLGTSADAIGLAGTTTIQLRSDRFYQFAFDLYADEGASALSQGVVSANLVPAPGTFGVLVSAGLLSMRRRRA